MPIVTNLTKAKTIAHDMRRAKRAEEFEPHDEVISKQITGDDETSAETARSANRTKYETVHTNIDAAADVDALITVLENM